MLNHPSSARGNFSMKYSLASLRPPSLDAVSPYRVPRAPQASFIPANPEAGQALWVEYCPQITKSARDF